MGWKHRYKRRKATLCTDENICPANRRVFKAFFRWEERKLKRSNGLRALDEACFKTLYGYPSWGSLLDALAELSIKSSPGNASDLAKLAGADVRARAQAYEDALGRLSFRQHLSQEFGPREPQFDEFHSDLIAIPFRHVLTTNYDDVLVAAYQAQHGCPPPIVDIGVGSDRGRFLTSYAIADYPCQHVFLHGRASSPDGMVLTKSDYDNRYVNGLIGKQLKGGIFTTSQIVFVGFSLKDEDFMYLLRELAGELGLTEPRHFALTEHPGSDAEVNTTTANLASKFGATPIFYERSDNHAALAALIKRLSHDAAAKRRAREAERLANLATIKIEQALSIIFSDEPTSRDRAIQQLPEALKHVGWPAMTDPGANGTTGIDSEIDSVFRLIDLGHPDEAIARYTEIERAHAARLDNRLRYRIKANIASATYAKGDDAMAGQMYLDATAIYRDGKNARGLEVVGYHLIGDDAKAATLANQLCAEYPDFARGHAFRIRSAPKDGVVVVRRDLPKMPKTIDMGPRPIWGDWSNGSFDLVITRHVYKKENRPAANLQLATRVLAIEDIGEPHAVLFTRVSATLNQSTPNFISELLAHLRLLKESSGACDLLNAAVTESELLQRIYVNWEILPPGQRDATIARILGSIKNPTSAEKQRMIDRYDNLAALNPEQWVVGQGGFDRYFGAVFPDHVALENVEYGNALYIMIRNKWEELSQLSRTELLSGARDGFTRIPHVGDWKNKVKAAIH